ncbi:hypothetical protein [Streptomyces sp. NPDC002690]
MTTENTRDSATADALLCTVGDVPALATLGEAGAWLPEPGWDS